MPIVGVKELKDRLTYYLRRTKEGDEVVVTERGRPVAVLRALCAADGASTLEARLALLAAQGRVTLPTRKPAKGVRTVRVTGRLVSSVILEERR